MPAFRSVPLYGGLHPSFVADGAPAVTPVSFETDGESFRREFMSLRAVCPFGGSTAGAVRVFQDLVVSGRHRFEVDGVDTPFVFAGVVNEFSCGRFTNEESEGDPVGLVVSPTKAETGVACGVVRTDPLPAAGRWVGRDVTLEQLSRCKLFAGHGRLTLSCLRRPRIAPSASCIIHERGWTPLIWAR